MTLCIVMVTCAALLFGAFWFTFRAVVDITQGSGAAAKLASAKGGSAMQFGGGGMSPGARTVAIADGIVRGIGPAGARWKAGRARCTIATWISRADVAGSCTPESLLLIAAAAALSSLAVALLFVPFLGPPAFLAGFFIPFGWLWRRRRGLVGQVVSSLPYTIELLAIAVDAGMDFMTALQRVVEKAKPGPLRKELQLMLQAIRLGSQRGRALRQLSDKLDVSSLKAVVSAMVQADRLGVPISNVLREQADFLRFERFQRAEQMGAVASQKILLPVMLFILPAFLLLTLGSVLIGVATGGAAIFSGGSL